MLLLIFVLLFVVFYKQNMSVFFSSATLNYQGRINGNN